MLLSIFKVNTIFLPSKIRPVFALLLIQRFQRTILLKKKKKKKWRGKKSRISHLLWGDKAERQVWCVVMKRPSPVQFWVILPVNTCTAEFTLISPTKQCLTPRNIWRFCEQPWRMGFGISRKMQYKSHSVKYQGKSSNALMHLKRRSFTIPLHIIRPLTFYKSVLLVHSFSDCNLNSKTHVKHFGVFSTESLFSQQ